MKKEGEQKMKEIIEIIQSNISLQSPCSSQTKTPMKLSCHGKLKLMYELSVFVREKKMVSEMCDSKLGFSKRPLESAF